MLSRGAARETLAIGAEGDVTGAAGRMKVLEATIAGKLFGGKMELRNLGNGFAGILATPAGDCGEWNTAE